ncbi:unnamed protein product [Clavelina lepadiformis]|uniref:Uncharacterized protein n=1 Tax=Clavelina lepadiformis TaxID=159417 RepID=A0ABP0G904_CLALP
MLASKLLIFLNKLDYNEAQEDTVRKRIKEPLYPSCSLLGPCGVFLIINRVSTVLRKELDEQESTNAPSYHWIIKVPFIGMDSCNVTESSGPSKGGNLHPFGCSNENDDKEADVLVMR